MPKGDGGSLNHPSQNYRTGSQVWPICAMIRDKEDKMWIWCANLDMLWFKSKNLEKERKIRDAE